MALVIKPIQTRALYVLSKPTTQTPKRKQVKPNSQSPSFNLQRSTLASQLECKYPNMIYKHPWYKHVQASQSTGRFACHTASYFNMRASDKLHFATSLSCCCPKRVVSQGSLKLLRRPHSPSNRDTPERPCHKGISLRPWKRKPKDPTDFLPLAGADTSATNQLEATKSPEKKLPPAIPALYPF